jgi:uncharacterized protein YbaP (TraB family)
MPELMKKLSFLLLLLFSFATYAQTPKKAPKPKPKPATNASTKPIKEKKYPSLLWEITGNGLKKPSYLFATMHISNKLAFNLGDSFYIALKSVDVVALEQDPDVWQEEYSKMSKGYNYNNHFSRYGYSSRPNDRLTLNIFSVKGYEERLKASLPLEARMVNGMLYRTDPSMEDFEEETYLDMYIYQSGKRLGKIVTGVEDFKESEKLVKKAYRALMKERYKKKKTYNYGDNILGYKKSEEAYRNGDLDLIDSIEMANIVSEEFQENFMYKRNDIQAHSIDTILKKHSLFVGVGAAHLPGKRGVVELLRQKGYKVRPIMMGERNSEEKDKLEKIRVPVSFKEQWMEDSAFSIKIPGKKLFRYPVFNGVDMQQVADMPNGSYYMVTRLRTNASILGHKPETVMKKIDSLLYENIPGKIITKKKINHQGVTGYEIINKTRKGDAQHYHIYVLADEIVILKASGVGDYITQGDEAEIFLSSIRFKNPAPVQAVDYKPPYGGFTVKFPTAPSYVATERNAKNRQEWTSTDANGNSYLLFKTALHHYDYIEEDTFDLSLAEESFGNSSFISKRNKRELTSWNGYPALQTEYDHKDGSKVKARFILQGNNYYVLATRAQKPETLQPYFETFKITQYEYPAVEERGDSLIGFKVKSPLWYPKKDEDKDELADMYTYMKEEDEDIDLDYTEQFKSTVIGNDTTGEHIFISRYAISEFSYAKDSAKFMKNFYSGVNDDSDYVFHMNKEYKTPADWLVREYQLRDTGSSRMYLGKIFYKQGVAFYVVHMGDTLSKPSTFVSNFMESFQPVDTLKFRNPFTKKTDKFFADYFSSDTTVAKKARNKVSFGMFDSTDLPNIKKAISQLTWDSKKYLERKRKWIDILGTLKDSATANYLQELYVQVKDTSDFQNDILDALVSMRRKYSFDIFKKLVLNDPPALVNSGSNYSYDYTRSYDEDYSEDEAYSYDTDYVTTSDSYDYGYNSGKWAPLYDTLQLTTGILPELVDLMILEDYSPTIMNLLVTAVDSGYLKADQYKQFYNRFSLEAKQRLKKQLATENQREIEKASKDNKEDSYDYYSSNEDNGNSKLVDYGVLLMPFWDNPEVQNFFAKLLTTKDKKLRMDVVLLMLRNKKSVHDSLIEAVAAQDNYRLRLYNDLERAKLLDKFPAKYKKQEDFSRSMLVRNSYKKPDSLIFLRKDSVSYKDQKGWLYFYKYKQSKDDDTWKIAVSGMQPFDEKEVTSKYKDYKRMFTEMTDEDYIDDATLATQIPKIVKEMKYAKRSSSRNFYQDKNSDLFESVLSDRVKEARYD